MHKLDRRRGEVSFLDRHPGVRMTLDLVATLLSAFAMCAGA